MLRASALGFLIATAPLALAAEPVVEAAPVLVTTDGPAQSWSDVKSLIADANDKNPVAMFEYAQLLERGDQVAADPRRALQLYRDAAAAGQREALFRLGKIHHDGLLGVPVDYPAAFRLYQRAAAARVPEAMYNIGAMLVSARGTKRDYVEGLAWLLVALENGAGAQAGVDQVRQRLARRPERIAAAEKRAAVLRQHLESGQLMALAAAGDATRPLAPAVPAPPRTASVPERPKATVAGDRAAPPPPKIEIARPDIAIPPPPPAPPRR